MYQVFVSDQGGLQAGPRFRFLADASRYVAAHRHERSFAIRKPDGSWHRDAAGRVILGRRRRKGSTTRSRGSQQISAVGGTGCLAGGHQLEPATPAAEPYQVEVDTDVGWPPIDTRLSLAAAKSG